MTTVLAPVDWGAQVNYDQWSDAYTPDDGIALHHGGDVRNYPAANKPYTIAKEMAQLQEWEAGHLAKGWRGLGYGWAIGQTGTIYRARGFNGYGAHAGDVDGDGISNNQEIIPVLWIANGALHLPTAEFHESMVFLRREILLPTSPNATHLYGHKEVQFPRTCPGPNGMAYVQANREIGVMLPDVDTQSLLARVAALELTVGKKADKGDLDDYLKSGEPILPRKIDLGT